HTIFSRDWSSDVCSSDLVGLAAKQTCQKTRTAISGGPFRRSLSHHKKEERVEGISKAIRAHLQGTERVPHSAYTTASVVVNETRSEERRVGKGGSGRTWT